jgi:Cys-tRNA(Pro)/Cys-tRNA(Cys) deacylase
VTPAIRLLESRKIAHQVHRYDHDANAESFGEEAASKLGVSRERLFKTLVAQVDGAFTTGPSPKGRGELLVMAILPVASRLDLKKLAATVDGKKADLADPKLAEKTTGYVVGGISPLGGRKALATLLDESAYLFDTIFISAGQRGMQIELAPSDLQSLTQAIMTSLTKD